MLAYALASKPCFEATDIGSILSWGSVFWWDLVGITELQGGLEMLRSTGVQISSV